MIENKKPICRKPEGPAGDEPPRLAFPRGWAAFRLCEGFFDEPGLFLERPGFFFPVAFERVRAAATCPSVSRMVHGGSR